MESNQRRVISLLVDNQSGVLARVSNLFCRRGFNIDTLTVSATNDPAVSRITLTITSDDRALKQLILQTERLEVTRQVFVLDKDKTLQRELLLLKVASDVHNRAELREKITSRKQEIQRLRGIVRSLYENLVQGVLTKDEYFDYKEKYESRIADLAVEMEQLEDGLRTMDAQAEQHRALEQDAAQIKTDRALTGALIERLIDRIEVSHDKQITVRYRFQSEFETYAEVLEQCRNM